jgi:Fe2+ or Zn2+ uptake regulation protein
MQISVQSSGKYATALRDRGFRATYGRVALLEALAVARKPISVEEAAKAIKGKLDLVNTYRALEALAKAGLVRRVDVGHRHMHYAIADIVSGKHAHQFVCVGCGLARAHYSH